MIADLLSRPRPHCRARRGPADVCDGAETTTANDDEAAIIAVVLCRRQHDFSLRLILAHSDRLRRRNSSVPQQLRLTIERPTCMPALSDGIKLSLSRPTGRWLGARVADCRASPLARGRSVAVVIDSERFGFPRRNQKKSW